MTTTSSEKLIKYLSEIKSQASKVMMDGYFPVNVVIDAFTKGEERGSEKVLDDLKEQFMRASTQMFLYGGDVLRDMQKHNLQNTGFYVNPFAFKFMITTAEANTYNEDFIDKFYSIVEIYEDKFKAEFDLDMRVSFIADDNLDEDSLLVDGFLKVANGEA